MLNYLKLIFIMFFIGCTLYAGIACYTAINKAMSQKADNINYIINNYK